MIALWRRLSIHPWIRPFSEWRIGLQWRLMGRPVPPPPLVKQALVKDYQRRFGLRVFVETGTFAGVMISAVLGRFDRIFSIELDDQWYARAAARFAARRDVTLLHGDSSTRLREVLAGLREPALFWLDAHYSGPITARGPLDSPIVQELEAIAAHPVNGHVVLIDDMRDFTGSGGYPHASTLAAELRRNHPADIVEIRDDVLRWHARS
ncbi:MAG TPA: hypothetical protein VFZ98_00185 [Vicinamibacterales bacterium]